MYKEPIKLSLLCITSHLHQLSCSIAGYRDLARKKWVSKSQLLTSILVDKELLLFQLIAASMAAQLGQNSC